MDKGQGRGNVMNLGLMDIIGIAVLTIIAIVSLKKRDDDNYF